MSGGWALRVAIFNAVRGDTGVQALIGDPARLFDDVPPGAAFPYVTFGEASETDWSTATETGTEHALTLEVWSKYEGHKEAISILDALESALHHAALTLTGHALINLQVLGKDMTRDPDRPLARGALHLRAVTEPTS